MSYVGLTLIALATSGRAPRLVTLKARDLPVAEAVISSGTPDG